MTQAQTFVPANNTSAGKLVSISKAEINQLPLIAWEGPVEVIDSVDRAKEVVAQLMGEPLLGFDTETRPTFKKGQYYPPSLVQLGTDEKVFLFRISEMGTIEPLIPLLENPAVEKSGVAVFPDLRELKKLSPFEPRGFVDVAEVATKAGLKERGLRPLTGLLLGGRISKAAQVSNWARQQLEPKQIQYAATDAWVSRELLVRLRAGQR